MTSFGKFETTQSITDSGPHRLLLYSFRLLQDEGVVTQDSRTMIEQENSNLRTTISRQSQKIGRLENELKRNEPFLKESGDLNNIIERQREKIGQYQREMEETKVHMSRLEELVHQVQEQSMKEHVNATPSVGNNNNNNNNNNNDNNNNINNNNNSSIARELPAEMLFFKMQYNNWLLRVWVKQWDLNLGCIGAELTEVMSDWIWRVKYLSTLFKTVLCKW